jgi:hypothetical protein
VRACTHRKAPPCHGARQQETAPSNIIYLFPPSKPRYAWLIAVRTVWVAGDSGAPVGVFDLVATYALVAFGIKIATRNLLILARF